MTANIQMLQQYKSTLIVYLMDKVAQQDWHGVSDAANDIRELDAKIAVLKQITDGENK